MSKYDFMKEHYAFPGSGDSTIPGMQLRDYFAAKAMAALLQSGQCRNTATGNLVISSLATESYEIGDAMVEEMVRTKANES